MMRKMRSLVTLLCATVLVVACSKERATPRIEISAEELLLSGDASGEASFTVRAESPWNLTCTGEGFTVRPTSGAAGETSVTVTPTAPNNEKNRRQLGAITLHYDNDRQQFEIAIYQRPATATRTVLLYMPGENLLRFYRQNIDGICRAVSADVPGDGRMLICWQPQNEGKATLEEICYDTGTRSSRIVTLKEYETFSAKSPADVATMLSDVEIWAPAGRYGLIIGCHGKAWVPRTAGNLSMNALRPNREEDLWIPAPGALPTRSFGDSGNELEIPELAEVLEAQSIRFDYLIFDACFMANIETLYDLRHAVDYVVASPCEIMAAGFPYERITPHLFTDATIRTSLEASCREFWEFYEYDWDTISGNEQSGCISLAVMSEIDALVPLMRDIKQAPQQSFDLNTLQSYEGFNNHLFFDLEQYVKESCADQGMIDAFNAQLEKAFPPACRLYTAQFYSEFNHRLNPVSYYSGVTVSEPSKNSKAPDNIQTAWYQATH